MRSDKDIRDVLELWTDLSESVDSDGNGRGSIQEARKIDEISIASNFGRLRRHGRQLYDLFGLG